MTYLIYCLTILFTTLLGYFVSMNIGFTIVIFFIFLTYFIALEVILRKRVRPSIIKSNDLNNFIHDFLLSYLDHSNIKLCLKNANKNISFNLKEEMRLLDEYSGIAILTNLENYFSSSLYSLFLLAIQKSGDRINENIKFILDENTLMSKKKDEVRKKNKKALIEFSLLWIVSFIIFTILRVSLNNYFDKLKNSFYYLVGISIYFLILFLSINLFVLIYYRRENI